MHPPLSQAPSLAVLIALSALAVLPLNMVVPSLPGMARDLHTDFATLNAAVAGYAMVTALVHLVAGTLSDRFGRKPVAMAALAVFTLASIGCSLSTDVCSFLLFRLLQAPVIAGYAISLAILRDTSSDGAMTGRIGDVTSAWAVAPMLGPLLGGVIDAHWGWRANFAVLALLGAAGLCAVAAHLRETHSGGQVSLAALLSGHRRLLGSPRFRAYTLCMAMCSGTLYLFLGTAPALAAQLGERSSTMLGLYMGLVPAGFMTGSWAVGRFHARHSPASLILAGRLLTCMGLLAAVALAGVGVAHPLAFFGPCVCLGLGNGLTLPVTNARILGTHPGLAGSAAGLAAALAMLGAGALAFVGGPLLHGPQARVAVPCAMLLIALMSMAAALWAIRAESGPSNRR